MDKFAKDIVLLLLKSNLLVKYNLNLFGSLILLFSVLIHIVSILYKIKDLMPFGFIKSKTIHQVIIDSF